MASCKVLPGSLCGTARGRHDLLDDRADEAGGLVARFECVDGRRHGTALFMSEHEYDRRMEMLDRILDRTERVVVGDISGQTNNEKFA